MPQQKREPKMGEELFLVKEEPDQLLFFHSVAEPEADLELDLGWEFEFNELLQYVADGRHHVVLDKRAQLVQNGGFAIFVFRSGEEVLLENVVVTRTLRAKRVYPLEVN